MIKKVLVWALMVSLATPFFAQDKKQNVAIGFHGGIQEYRGEVGGLEGDQFLTFNKHAAYGVSFTKYLNKNFDAMVMGTFSNLTAQDSISSFHTRIGDINLLLKYKPLKETIAIQPHLFVGVGDAFSRVYQPNQPSIRDISFNVLGGLGFDINLGDKWAVNLMSKYTYLWTDGIDDRGVNVDGNMNDMLLTHTAGLKYKFRGFKDADEDGIADKDDVCPNVFGLEKFQGCPDTDSDGIKDSEDMCPNTAGLATLSGCPDADKDGIADKDDACPSVAGLKTFAGCPDTDGDGIKDGDDACPNTPGKLKGCPDSDKDGVADKNDACPKVYGTVKGCPDSDKDGVIDSQDNCPKVAGPASNQGCPVKKEIKEEAKQILQKAMEGLFFNTSSAVIKTESYGVLDNVVSVLKSEPAYKLVIDGHTDSQGDAAKNLALSQRRAEAAKQYLISKGIDGSRLTATSHGETQPRATNATAAGRALNRRVEFLAIP